MFGVVEPIKRGLLKTRSVKADNFVFGLHYKITALIFLSASGILVSNQLFGKPIDCINDGSEKIEEAFKDTIDNWCWVTSTFTVKEHLCGKIGTEVIYAGIGNTDSAHSTPLHVHVTYRFLFFVLFLQGVSFFMPHYFWKSWEGGKMKMLSKDLENPMLDDKERDTKFKGLTDYFLKHGQSINGCIKYTFQLHLCELMNLIITGVNIWMLDFLFAKEFIGYGFKMLTNMKTLYYNPECDDPIQYLFPRVTKCIQKSFGPSGTIQFKDSICLMLLNDFNSNFFKFIWFWLAILLSASIIWMLFRVLTIYSQWMRVQLLSRKAGSLSVDHTHGHDAHGCCGRICRRLGYADWVVLMQLGANMDALTFKLFLEAMCKKIVPNDMKPEVLEPQRHLKNMIYPPV